MSFTRGIAGAVNARQRMKVEQRTKTGADSLAGILDRAKARARSPLELEKLANALGLQYSRWQQLGLVDQTVPLHRVGRGHEVESVLHGVVGGVPLALFDYEHVPETAARGFERHFTCAQVGVPIECPSFRASTVARGPNQIAIEADPGDGAFNQRLLTKDVRAWMLQGGAGVEYHAGGLWTVVASPPIVLDKWEGLARRGIQWAAQVAGLAQNRTRVV